MRDVETLRPRRSFPIRGLIESLVGLGALLPGAAFVTGQMLWAGASWVNYGVDVSPLLSTATIITAGSLYVAVLLSGLAVAVLLGPSRLLPRYWGTRSRVRDLAVEVSLALGMVAGAGTLGGLLARSRWSSPSPTLDLVYLLFHIWIVGLVWRRINGLWLARFYVAERLWHWIGRRWRPVTSGTRGRRSADAEGRERAWCRGLSALLFVLLIWFQIQLASVYSVAGLNLARRQRMVEFVDPNGVSVTARLVEMTNDRLLYFNTKSGAVEGVLLTDIYDFAVAAQ